MKKVIQFSKGFLPSAIISAVIIVFGIIGFFTKGINLGLDFKPGLVEEVRIAPVAINVTYSGAAKVVLEISNEKLDVVVSGTGAENETKTLEL
jgi:preprotein translocase subunit SecF